MPGDKAAMTSVMVVRASKVAQGKEKAPMQQLRNGDCVEEPDWADVCNKMFEVSRMQGNLEEGLKEVNRSIYQVAENAKLVAEKANANADKMVLLLLKVLVQLSEGLLQETSMDARSEMGRMSETAPKEGEAEEAPPVEEQETIGADEAAAAVRASMADGMGAWGARTSRKLGQGNSLLPIPSEQEIAGRKCKSKMAGYHNIT
ncbi:unnamed protein product [Linum trigynum]